VTRKRYEAENNAKHRTYEKIAYICGQKIQNDYLQASHITAIFTCYWAYNAYFKLQKERHVTEIEQAAQYSWRCQLQTFFP
jgi:hypothetical protein